MRRKITQIAIAVTFFALPCGGALADPWVAVDASPNSIMFLNNGAIRDIDANTKDVEILIGVRRDVPLLMMSKFQVRCRDNAIGEYSRAIVDGRGNIGPSQSINLQFMSASSGTMGYNLLYLACAGIQAGNVNGIRRPTLGGAIDFAKNYLGARASK